MENNETYYADLITRYLAGEANEDDRIFLGKWLEASPDNRKIFEEYRKAWLEVEISRIESSIDLDEEWDKLNKRIEKENPKIISINRGRTRSRNFAYAIAATILLLAIPAFVILLSKEKVQTRYLEARTEIASSMLPDGSTVTLNRGAVLEYPSRFKKGNRQVSLAGEAYFEVKHDETKPFVISSGEVRIEVLGTSFYVNTDKGPGKLEVILNSGSVKISFSDDPGNGVVLTPGEKAEVDKRSRKITSDVNADENYLSWKTGRMVFNNTPLIEIIRVLQKDYHAHIELGNPMLAQCLVTATFENQSMEAVLNVLKATLNINISYSGQTIILTGESCK